MNKQKSILNSFLCKWNETTIKQAFTLVELIVVITILAILGTIGFINLQGFSSDARDSKRISELSEIRNGLQIYQARNSLVPTPSEQSVTIGSGSTNLIIQGYVGESVLNEIKMNGNPKDPLDNKYYTYSVNASKTKFQLLALLENDNNLTSFNNLNIISTTHASYTNRYLYVLGQNIGILLDETTNIPLQELVTLVDLNTDTNNYKVVFANNNQTSTLSGELLYNEIITQTNNNGIVQNNEPVSSVLITSIDCSSAGWIWVASDVYIGSTQGDGFCISPRIGDFGDSTGNGISFNGWGNQADGNYGGWDSTSIDDSGNPYPQYGQTKRLDSSVGYTCKSLGSSSTDFDTTDNIVGRMKWLATNKVNLAELQDIEWVQGAIPPNGHPIPALYIADCIDGVKDLGTTMTYIHNNDTTYEVTYAEYSTDVSLNTDTAYLSDTTYQNRQKYLTAWTQKTGSHLPSAMSYITSGFASAGDSDGDFLTGSDRGEYQVACEASLLTDANDDTDNEWIWTSAIGNTTGAVWGRNPRIIGSSGCGDQGSHDTGHRSGTKSARFVIRP